jgi:hypothetical protein
MGRQHSMTSGCFRDPEPRRQLSGGILEAGTVVSRPTPVRQLSPNRSVSQIQILQTRAPLSGRWRPHPIGQQRPVDVVTQIVDNWYFRHRDYLMHRLQPSRFYTAGGVIAEPIYILDGVVSEWLFASGIRERIHSLLGTMFDQFEEDEAESTVLLQIASEQESCIRSLHSQGGDTVCFICGWSPSRDAHTVEVQRNGLVSQVVMLRNLPASAAANREVLEFSL